MLALVSKRLRKKTQISRTLLHNYDFHLDSAPIANLAVTLNLRAQQWLNISVNLITILDKISSTKS